MEVLDVQGRVGRKRTGLLPHLARTAGCHHRPMGTTLKPHLPTPFERNIEVWRQFRLIPRPHLSETEIPNAIHIPDAKQLACHRNFPGLPRISAQLPLSPSPYPIFTFCIPRCSHLFVSAKRLQSALETIKTQSPTHPHPDQGGHFRSCTYCVLDVSTPGIPGCQLSQSRRMHRNPPQSMRGTNHSYQVLLGKG